MGGDSVRRGGGSPALRIRNASEGAEWEIGADEGEPVRIPNSYFPPGGEIKVILHEVISEFEGYIS